MPHMMRPKYNSVFLGDWRIDENDVSITKILKRPKKKKIGNSIDS